jgi:hypothetical protein
MTPEHLFLALLHLYPPAFRSEFGDEMVATFYALRQNDRRAAIPFWFFVIGDLAYGAWRVRLHTLEPAVRHLLRCSFASVLATTILVAAIVVSLSALRRPLDTSETISVIRANTGWVASEAATGKTKLVPSVTLTLKNVGHQQIAAVHVLARFSRAGGAQPWGDAHVRVVGSRGLPPGAVTAVLKLRSQAGYTGPEFPAQMLRNPHFIDASAEVLFKHGSSNWMNLGEWPIERALLSTGSVAK